MQCNPYCAKLTSRIDNSSFAPLCRLNIKVFTDDKTKKILQVCKANRRTVTGALAAAANLAFCDLIQDGQKNQASGIKWQFAINAQRLCNPKPTWGSLCMLVMIFG